MTIGIAWVQDRGASAMAVRNAVVVMVASDRSQVNAVKYKYVSKFFKPMSVLGSHI